MLATLRETPQRRNHAESLNTVIVAINAQPLRRVRLLSATCRHRRRTSGVQPKRVRILMTRPGQPSGLGFTRLAWRGRSATAGVCRAL